MKKIYSLQWDSDTKLFISIFNSWKHEVSKTSPFYKIKIPNDEELNQAPKRSFLKGFQLKKYSEFFSNITEDDLFSAIISFAETQGFRHFEDSKMSSVLLESEDEETEVSIKANIVGNTFYEMQCIECIKINGDKTPFMKVFSMLCQHCKSLENMNGEKISFQDLP